MPPFDAQEFDRFRQKHSRDRLKAICRSIAALRDPRIASLPFVVAQLMRSTWIVDNSRSSSVRDSEILAIRMHGTEGAADDWDRFVDAVAQAYLNEVVFADEQRRCESRCDRKIVLKTSDELIEARSRICRRIARAADDKPDVKLRNRKSTD